MQLVMLTTVAMSIYKLCSHAEVCHVAEKEGLLSRPR